MGAHFSTNLSSWLLAVPGSPSSSTLMSPRRVKPSGRRLRAPPKSRQATAALISCAPQIDGAIDCTRRSYTFGAAAKERNCSISTSVKRRPSLLLTARIVDDSSFSMPSTRTYGMRTPAKVDLAFALFAFTFLIAYTPTMVTRLPGATRSVR